MQTKLSQQYSSTPQGKEANEILRTCVHCGFCTATCPTYQLLGDELDSPRGRIYLIKQLLEGYEVTEKTQTHLDRCLTCRACETTCPSGVQYGRLIDIGREIIEQKTERKLASRLKRYLLRQLIPYPERFTSLITLARIAKPLLPGSLKNKIPNKQNSTSAITKTHRRKMLLLESCAQKSTSPATNNSAISLLNKLEIELFSIKQAGCCGAVSQHLSAENESLSFMRRNIDAWWPHIESGIEAIVITASGCGVMVKDYGHLLKNDNSYAEKARRVSAIAKDISEIIQQEQIPKSRINTDRAKIAFHSPCTLQHGQKLDGIVENILSNAGFELCNVNDKHLCCGSAGTYSILQPEISQQLLNNKLDELQKNKPDIIATANIGCQLHINTKADIPVKHWIELLNDAM